MSQISSKSEVPAAASVPNQPPPRETQRKISHGLYF